MRISSTQPSQGLFFKQQDVPTHESSENFVHGLPHNRPQLSIIKTEKTASQNWTPLAKLALATATVINATTLGLAYTYYSTTPEIFHTPHTHTFNIPTLTPKPTSNASIQKNNLLPPESEPISSPFLVVTSIFIGAVLGYLISKCKTDDSSYEKQIQELNKKKNPHEPKDNLLTEITQLQTKKAELKQKISDIHKEFETVTAEAAEKLKNIKETMKQKVEEIQKEQEKISDQMTQQERIKKNLLNETASLEKRQSQIKSKLNNEIATLQAKKESLEDQISQKNEINSLRLL